MQDYLNDTALLVYAATALQAAGLLLRNQIVLRLLLLAGTAFYLLYYYHHADTPLWEALIGSSILGLANLIGLARLLYSRLPFGLTGRAREIYDSLGTLEPGMFRRLMRIATIHETDQPALLTEENRRAGKLFYVLGGRPRITKGASAFRVGDRVFIAEVGYLLDVPATATADLPDGGVYVEWNRDRLLRLCDRDPRLRQALDALITRDMARKVAAGIQTAERQEAAERQIAAG